MAKDLTEEKSIRDRWSDLSLEEQDAWMRSNPPPTKEAWSKLSVDERQQWMDVNPEEDRYLPGVETKNAQAARLAEEKRVDGLMAALINKGKENFAQDISVVIQEATEGLAGTEKLAAEKVADAVTKELKAEGGTPEGKIEKAWKTAESLETKGRDILSSATSLTKSSFATRAIDVLKAAGKLITEGINAETISAFKDAFKALFAPQKDLTQSHSR